MVFVFVFTCTYPAIAETDPTKAIAEAKKDVLLSLGGVVAGSINTNPTQQEIEIPLNPEISPAQTETIKAPKVQLNLLDFIPVIRNLRALNRAKKAKGLEPDTYFVPKGELVLELRDSTDSLIFEKREKLTISSAVSWEKLVSDLEIKEDGNLSVFIDNSSSDKVYFDNFEIEKTEATVAVVVQENHYYPFGMNMKGIEELDLQSLNRKDEHRWQFNGTEKNDNFDLNWNETFYRTYDMQLGRWNHIDPLSEKFASWSSYHGMGNNPIAISDPNGDDWNISTTTDDDGNMTININFTAAVWNNSDKKVDTEALAKAAKEQMERIFSGSISSKDGTKVTLNMTAEIRAVSDFSEIKKSEHVYEVVPDAELGRTKDGEPINGVSTPYMKHIKLNVNSVEKMISGEYHTLAHEAGHTLGWSHPNETGIDNSGMDKDEQHLPYAQNPTNLMYSTGYRTNWKVHKDAISISSLQINIMLRNYKAGNLNINGKLHKKIKERVPDYKYVRPIRFGEF